MSGVEALSLLLGILPLLVSAIEHYDDVLRPVRRYRGFSSKSQRFYDELETERTVFYAECQLLLGELVGLDIAQEMLCDPKHPSWRDDSLCKKLETRLGSLKATCLSTISKIQSKLNDISGTFKDFLGETPQPSDADFNTYKKWLRTKKTKLKFAFSEDTLRTAVSDLRSQNENFRVISSQIVRFNRLQTSQNEGQRRRLSFSRRMDLRKFEMIRTASCRLYEALSQACTIHRDHLAKFCLEAICNESEVEIGCVQICFSLAYTPVPIVPAISTSQSLPSQKIEEIECSAEGSITEDPGATDSSAVEIFRNAKWLEVESVMGSRRDTNRTQSHQAVAGSPLHIADGHGEHHHADDFCVKLKTRMDQEITSSAKTLILVLDSTERYKHHVYYPSHHVPSSLDTKSTSLIELLSPSKGNPIGNIPQLHRIRIARSLVVAVLKFSATPWLTESWQSKNLLFNNVSPEKWQSYIPPPHLVVRVSSSKQPAKSATITRLPSLLPPIVPNLMLFNLGVMLLELAYGVPFQSLSQRYPNVDPLVARQVAEFNAAYHLANNVGVFFGSGYADVVRKCLRCDFGMGEDLNEPALRERLYEDVVCRLEDMEDGIRKSQGEV